MEFKGTKGKRPQGWEVYFSTDIGTGDLGDITVMPKGNTNSNEEIAICWDYSRRRSNGGLKLEEAKANAQLISKAPEILDKLNEAIIILGDVPLGTEMQEWLDSAKQLIKEATTI